MSNPQLGPSPRRGSPNRIVLWTRIMSIDWFCIMSIPIVALLYSATTAHGFHALLDRWQPEGRKQYWRPSTDRESSTELMLSADSVSALDIGFVKRLGKIAARVRMHLGEAIITAVYNTAGGAGRIQRNVRQTHRRWWSQQVDVLDNFRTSSTEPAAQMMVT